MKDPAIDQSLLGTSYEVTLPMTVIKVTDDYVVTNTATQLVNDVRKDTNQVSNPLKPINPAKDVVVKVDGQSVDGKSIYLNSLFLYRLDSSTLPPDRAYPQVSDWSISDPLDTRTTSSPANGPSTPPATSSRTARPWPSGANASPAPTSTPAVSAENSSSSPPTSAAWSPCAPRS